MKRIVKGGPSGGEAVQGEELDNVELQLSRSIEASNHLRARQQKGGLSPELLLPGRPGTGTSSALR